MCVFQWWQTESGPVCPGHRRLTCVWNGRGSVTAVSIPASSQQPWWNVIWNLQLKLKCCQVVLLTVDFSLPLVFMRQCVLSEWLCLLVLSHCELDDVVYICVFCFFAKGASCKYFEPWDRHESRVLLLCFWLELFSSSKQKKKLNMKKSHRLTFCFWFSEFDYFSLTVKKNLIDLQGKRNPGHI